jgi:hypothetical protein
MGLKAIHDTVDEIDEPFRSLYTERDGKFHLSGVEGVKTQADIDRLQGALTKERNDHKTVKDRLDKFAAFGEVDPSEILAKLDRLPELEAAAAGKLDEDKIKELAENRVNVATAPLKRDLEKIAKERDTVTQERDVLRDTLRSRDIKDAVLSAVLKAKVTETAIDDVLMLADRVFEVNEDGTITAKDGMGVTPGSTPEGWLQEMQPKRPHWWPASQGGGAGGGNGPGGGFADNPWAADQWNMTKQGQIYNQDPKKAEHMAKLAGTTVGGPRPALKK